MSKLANPHTASNDFVYGKKIRKKAIKKNKIFKMSVGKDHAASNTITNSMAKNVTYNYSFHFTTFY